MFLNKIRILALNLLSKINNYRNILIAFGLLLVIAILISLIVAINDIHNQLISLSRRKVASPQNSGQLEKIQDTTTFLTNKIEKISIEQRKQFESTFDIQKTQCYMNEAIGMTRRNIEQLLSMLGNSSSMCKLGERLLKSILVDFEKQSSSSTQVLFQMQLPNGKRPDATVVFTTPNGQKFYIHIDSKMSSLSSDYSGTRSSTALSAAEKKEIAKKLIIQIRGLSGKKYGESKNSCAIVLLYVAYEGYAYDILNDHPEIIRLTNQLNIVIVTSITLVPILNMLILIMLQKLSTNNSNPTQRALNRI